MENNKSKVRSQFSYWNDFRDGSSYKLYCFTLSGDSIQWHTREARILPEDMVIEVVAAHKVPEASLIISSPIGPIHTLVTAAERKANMTISEYRKLVEQFWINGPESFSKYLQEA